jgi:voltage-gated potassium channel
VLNWMIWLAFVAEVVIMLRVVPDRGRWLRDHPLDLAIVIFTPPFLPAARDVSSPPKAYATPQCSR